MHTSHFHGNNTTHLKANVIRIAQVTNVNFQREKLSKKNEPKEKSKVYFNKLFAIHHAGDDFKFLVATLFC